MSGRCMGRRPSFSIHTHSYPQLRVVRCGRPHERRNIHRTSGDSISFDEKPVEQHTGDAVEIRFAQSTRRHRVGHASARYVMATATPTPTETSHGESAWFYLGPDERGRELEIIAVRLRGEKGGDVLLVIPCDADGATTGRQP